jgi:dTMP kinase
MVFMRGKIIVIEGGEGAGKSTLCASLQQIYTDIVFTSEPKNTVYGQACYVLLKSYWNSISDFSTFCLMWSQRKQHWNEIVQPSIESGKTVICDRCDGSTYAYQVYRVDVDITMRKLFWYMRSVCFGDCTPDLYIYLDIDPLVSLERRRQDNTKEMTDFDNAEIEKHYSIRAGYREFMSDSWIKGYIINADRSAQSVLSDAIGLISAL